MKTLITGRPDQLLCGALAVVYLKAVAKEKIVLVFVVHFVGILRINKVIESKCALE